MMTNEQWTARLDRQWEELRRQEAILSMYRDDGLPVDLAEHNVKSRASDYARSVKDAPAESLLSHARNMKQPLQGL